MILRPKYAVGFDFFGQLLIIFLGFLFPIYSGILGFSPKTLTEMFGFIVFFHCIMLAPFQLFSAFTCTFLYYDIDKKRFWYWGAVILYFILLVSLNKLSKGNLDKFSMAFLCSTPYLIALAYFYLTYKEYRYMLNNQENEVE